MQRFSMLEADIVRLKHMLDAANEIVEFTRKKTQDDFNSDRKLHLSVVHLLEIIGEAEHNDAAAKALNIIRDLVK